MDFTFVSSSPPCDTRLTHGIGYDCSMSSFRRLYNVARGKIKTLTDPETAPRVNLEAELRDKPPRPPTTSDTPAAKDGWGPDDEDDRPPKKTKEPKKRTL